MILNTFDCVESNSSRHYRGLLPLSIHHIPISITFALFKSCEAIIDPSTIEEQVAFLLSFVIIVENNFFQVMDGRITITLNAQRQVRLI